jgi:hypothetical protein
MMLGNPETEWVAKLGPITRTNQAKAKEQAESGARQKVSDAVKAIMEKVRPAIPLLKEGAQCAGGGVPEAKEELGEVQVHSYQLDKGDWFTVASSGAFGVKLVCKK